MAEPTVPVPVSLIVRAIEGLLKAPGRDAVLVSGELHALLSQPTPTAEPPRIEDMAPGTTFLARHSGHWKRFEYDGAGRIRFVGGNGTWFLLNGPRGTRIDPSTIRDVTPPAVTP